MSVDTLRNDAIRTRQHDVARTLRSLRRSQRGLRSVTNLLATNSSLSTLLNKHLDLDNTPPPESEEAEWLHSNDVSIGRSFDDTSIPFPSLTQDGATIYASKPNRSSTKTPDAARESIDAAALDADGATAHSADPSSSLHPVVVSSSQYGVSSAPNSDDDGAVAATYSRRASQQPDGALAPPGQIAPPMPEDEANLSDDAKELLDLETPEKPAKVIHLPPQEVQEERLRERAEDRLRKSEEAEQAKSTRTHLQTQNELASSPSSTVGAYSAATPMPPQDSPDTSPDSENGEQIEVLPPKDMRPSPEEQREKEEHDRLLAAQKEIARRQALGDVSTPDDQLKWEEREAAARDAEETAAREDVNGPEPKVNGLSEETAADEVMKEVEGDDDGEVQQQNGNAGVPDQASEMQDTAERSTVPQEDGDNITVTPRTKLPLSIDTSTAQQSTLQSLQNGHPTPEQERMTTRTSSGVLQRRSTSELLGQTPSRRDFLSPEVISPMSTRHPQPTPVAAAPSQNPRRLPRPPGHDQNQTPNLSDIEILLALKGAADDPDRDYLEPLFRIQAHDSPNVRTTSLPDLIRSASKTLTTEDQFTMLHERVDYRLLRRVYQLQNANKWSLRQMERWKEPEQPVSHHDHLMAEMQWMRKDFKAEKKMKKRVCAEMARACAEWIAAEPEERMAMQVQVRKQPPPQPQDGEEQVPELEQSGDSAPEDEAGPPTPTNESALPSSLVVPPELSDIVCELQKSAKLTAALENLPVTGLSHFTSKVPHRPALTPASKFVDGKVLPKVQGPARKRKRFDYSDDADVLISEPETKRPREERDLVPEDQDIALFDPENKPIRDRLHANNAFRPPSEFVMPSTQFYEFRNGSQWIWEDDQKLRRLAKEYSFNWSLIADELQLPMYYKSSAERRTPWECFERWVELEQLPAEMKKTMYFKTWYQRLEQSGQAADRRYAAQLAALQAQGQQVSHAPARRKTVPMRVEKRKGTRYLWLVDAMRKGARKREQGAFKQAETQRAAAQRKTQGANGSGEGGGNQQQPARQPMLTPQEFSKRRYESDLKMQEMARQHRQKMFEAHQRQVMAARQQAQQQQGQGQGANGVPPNQQRPNSSSNAPLAQQAQMQQQANGAGVVQNGQMQQPSRPQVPMKNGHLAPPQQQMNNQGMGISQQAQMRPNGNGQMPSPQQMQQMAQAQAQRNAQQFHNSTGQQGWNMGSNNANMTGGGDMTSQQQLQANQAMLQNIMQQQQMSNMSPQAQMQSAPQGQQRVSGSPNMPPPPTPQSLSSGLVPHIVSMKASIQAKFPQASEEEVMSLATEMLRKEHSSAASNTNPSQAQARQNAMNAAAGPMPGQQGQWNQAAFQQNASMPNMSSAAGGTFDQQQPHPASPQQAQYAALMRARQMRQMQMQQQGSPQGSSPGMAHASPNTTNMTPASPNMNYASMQGMQAGGMQHPGSRSATPQMQRLGSSGNMAGGMPSPGPGGLQGSPRQMQASMSTGRQG